MTFANRSRITSAILFAFSSLALGTMTGCSAATADEPTGEAESPLFRSPVGGIGRSPPIVLLPPIAPPVSLPAYWDAASRTDTTVSLGWYETATNPKTLVYRQRYDLDGNVVGAPTLIKTFTQLPQGNASFVDSTATTDDQSGPDTDRLNCYRVVEQADPACGPAPGGSNCVSTVQACAYTRSATPHPIARVQLRIKASTVGTAAAPGDHVQVRLQSKSYPYALLPIPRNNSTWLDSTQVDFTAGSNYTYDLKTTNITDLSDITQITVATPDSDGFCVNELELLVDGTSAFTKSFGANGVDCQWAYQSDSVGGSVATATFGDLRRSASWQGFNPPNLGFGDHYASFVGYRGPELIAYLDSVMGDALRNPANGRGDDAGFRNTNWTTTWRGDRRTLHVSQHIVAQDEGWQGDVSADPSYDLVIHNDASCGSKQWCIAVENVQANSSFSGWSSFIPLIGAGIQIAVNSVADGQMAKAMTSMGGDALGAPPAGFEYCFPSDDIGDSPFVSKGFGSGSLTLCWAR